MAEAPQNHIEVNVRGLAVGGAGVGEVVAQSGYEENLLGITAFVPFSAPGETVFARVTNHKERFVEGELLSVETSSEERVEPKCKYFRVCGGCELQHMSENAQRNAKNGLLERELKAARFESSILAALEPIVSSKPYAYRRRISLHVDRTGKIGFYRPNSRSVVAIESCEIANPKINELLANIQPFGSSVQGLVSQIDLEADENSVIAVLKCPYDMGQREIRAITESAKKHFSSAVLVAAGKEVAAFGRGFLELPLLEGGGLKLLLPPGAFSQVNWAINRELIDYVVSSCAGEKQVHDLYAGAGNFSLPLAYRGSNVIAVECEPRLVQSARKSAQSAGLSSKFEIRELSTEKFLKRIKSSDLEVVVADPPRSGLGNLIRSFTKARKMVLVSCHIPSFIRDLRGLTEQGWKVDEIQPFDMFPQTSHLEVATRLVRET